MDEDTITLPYREYLQLVEDSRLLAHLEANGVDNWEGYSHPDWDDEEEDEDD